MRFIFSEVLHFLVGKIAEIVFHIWALYFFKSHTSKMMSLVLRYPKWTTSVTKLILPHIFTWNCNFEIYSTKAHKLVFEAARFIFWSLEHYFEIGKNCKLFQLNFLFFLQIFYLGKGRGKLFDFVFKSWFEVLSGNRKLFSLQQWCILDGF